jgi:hypothetical protein
MIRLAVRVTTALAAFVLLAANAGRATAGFIGTVTIQGTGTGTFEGKTFTNAMLTFTATYNTSDITLETYPQIQFPHIPSAERWSAPAIGGGPSMWRASARQQFRGQDMSSPLAPIPSSPPLPPISVCPFPVLTLSLALAVSHITAYLAVMATRFGTTI